MKGQYFSFDVLFATIVFILAFTYFLTQWNQLFSKPAEYFFEDGYRIASLLVSANPYFGILFDEETQEINTYLLEHPEDLRGKVYNLLRGTPYNIKLSINKSVYWNGCIGAKQKITFVRVAVVEGWPVPVEIVVCPKS